MGFVSVGERFSNKVVFVLLFGLVVCWGADLAFSWSWIPAALLAAASLSAAWLLLDALVGERNVGGRRINALLGLLILNGIADRAGFLPGWVSVVLFGAFVVLVIWHLVSRSGSRRGTGPA